MTEFIHLVLTKFKEDVDVEELLKGMEKLVAELDVVRSYQLGYDKETFEMLRQGFTHAFILTFNSKEDFTAYSTHPNHLEYSAKFSQAIEKAVVLDFNPIKVKAPA